MSIAPMQYLRTVVCAKSIIESETGNLSLIDLLDDITIHIKEPIPDGQTTNFPITFDIVSFWKKEKGQGDRVLNIKLEILDPQNTALGNSNADFIFPSDKLNFRCVLKMSNFPLTTSGLYKLQLSYKEHDEKEYRIAGDTSLAVTVGVLPRN